MARQSPDRRNAEDPADEELGDLDILDDDAEDGPADADSADADPDPDDDSADADPDRDDEPETGRDSATEALWAELRVDAVELALPSGSGYTLRAYRPVDELTPSIVEAEEDDDPFARRPARPFADEDDDTLPFEGAPAGVGSRRRADDLDEDDDEPEDLDDDEDEDEDEVDSDIDEEEDEEEVPVFLGHRGKLFLFRTPRSLVEFIRSGAEHDLTQLDSWSEVVARVQPEDVTASEDDSYELDLVVENLRGGHDAWDATLLISAGEIARDLAYAYRIEPVLTALAPGTPLDDLDEALRGTVEGGLGSFFARRRLRKIGAQQATLGWRTIIGKISGVVVWRD